MNSRKKETSMKFSQRIGQTPIEFPIQKDKVSMDLRISLWNVMNICLWDKWRKSTPSRPYTKNSKEIDDYVKVLWMQYFKLDMDYIPAFKFPNHGKSAKEIIKSYYMSFKWYEIYDFIEFTAKKLNLFDELTRSGINKILEVENSAYRLVGSNFIETTNEFEIKAIEEGIASESVAVSGHLSRAMQLLSDRKSPDYRNSIKESISAVETVCRIIVKDEKVTLGRALKKIPSIHGSLLSGFSHLYGYTSDEAGIRHSLLDESSVTCEDAKFMLVSCSGFCSYLLTKIKNP